MDSLPGGDFANVVSSHLVRKMIAVAGDAPVQQLLLESVGLSPESRSGSPPAMISSAAYYDLVERISEQWGHDPGLPYRYARSVRADDFGALGLGFKTAGTAGAALQCVVRYLGLLTNAAVYELREDPQSRHADAGGLLLILHRGGERAGERLSNESCLAELVSLLREITAGPVSPNAVTFRHAPSQTSRDAHEFFGCAVHFQEEHNALRFSREALATPALLADAGLSRYLQSRLEEDLRSIRRARSFEEQVRFAIADSFSEGVPHMQQIARRMGISERTLARRLAESGHAYNAMRDAARQELAESLLRKTDYTLLDVAFLTGFSEQSAFQRAFKRWTGRTPANFRKTIGSD